MTVKRTATAVVALAAMMTAAGCGSSDDDGAGAKTSEPIKYGAQIDLTGPAAFAGLGAQYGIELALDEINANGGINGRKLRLVAADSKTDPAAGALAVRKLAQQDKVAFIHSAASSTSTVGAAPVTEQLEVPLVSSMASDPKLLQTGKQSVYLASPTPHDVTGRFIADFAQQQFHPKTVAIVIDTATVHTPIVREAVVDRLGELGVKVVADLTMKQGDTSFGTQIRTLQSAKPDLIFTLGYAVVVSELLKDARAAGLNQQFIGDYGQVADDMLKVAGKAGEGYVSVWMGGPYLDDQGPAMSGFRAAFAKKFPDADAAYPNFGTAQAYSDTYVIADAIRRAGDDITPASVEKALDTTKHFLAGPGTSFPYAFAIGRPLSWTAANHVGSDQLTPLVINDGKWAQFDGA
jgi:branched-chain amino acid transport system substrate-binding protein